MKRLFFLFFLLVIFQFNTISFAKDSPEISTMTLYILEGRIDKKYPITMYLYIDKNRGKAEAKYYYDNVGEFLYLDDGVLSDNSTILLKQTNSDEVIKGSIDKNMVLKGVWSNSKKSYSIELKPNINRKIDEIEIESYLLSKDEFSFRSNFIKIGNPKKISGINKINKKLKDKYDSNIKDSIKDKDLMRFSDGYNIEYIDNTIISLNYDEYSLYIDSGAYGSSRSLPTVYSIDSGEVLNSIDDLFLSVDNPRLVALMQKKLKDLFDGNTDIYNIGFENIRLNNSYYVDATGITFVYNQEEIAPHAAGIIRIKFSYQELKPFVKKTSKLYYLFN